MTDALETVPRPGDDGGMGVSYHSGEQSRLRRVNDAVLIAVIALPQIVWLAVVAYLLHRRA
jgi:hypothetical protein